nr:immunoglobulin superfamily member 6 isoform X2 [Zootoca vivipara]
MTGAFKRLAETVQLTGADFCKVTVSQPPFMEGYPASKYITIPCTFSAQGCPTSTPTILWFRYLARTHEALCTPYCINSTKFKLVHSKSMNQAQLEIKEINEEDSAIYFCGVAISSSNSSTSKQTGIGTVLVIRGSGTYSRGVEYSMLAISVTLFLYLVALLAVSKLFTKPKLKKTERHVNVCVSVCNPVHKVVNEFSKGESLYEQEKELPTQRREVSASLGFAEGQKTLVKTPVLKRDTLPSYSVRPKHVQ